MRGLQSRIERLEQAAAIGRDALTICVRRFSGGDLTGMACAGTVYNIEPRETPDELIKRVERTAERQPWGGIVITEVRAAA